MNEMTVTRRAIAMSRPLVDPDPEYHPDLKVIESFMGAWVSNAVAIDVQLLSIGEPDADFKALWHMSSAVLRQRDIEKLQQADPEDWKTTDI